MPSFAWNLVMCFVMGLAVGGMLPICYALLAETIPARHRSWLMILIGADIAGAYIVTSWLAVALVPTYSASSGSSDCRRVSSSSCSIAGSRNRRASCSRMRATPRPMP